MDPHSLNESLQLSFTGNVYEPLVGRDKKLGLAPALATKWKQTSPTVWRFELRKGVSFHDGTPFTADDVVFSFERAAGDGSDMKSYTSAIKEVRKIDDFTVEIETERAVPDPAGRDLARLHHEQEVVRGRTRPSSRSTAARASRTPPRSAPTAPARSA